MNPLAHPPEIDVAAERSAALELADRLRPALLRLSRRLRREAERSGLSVMDAQLLGSVYKSPGISASELADGEQISRPTMSAHVRRLEEAGWVAREAPGAAEDRRRQGLHATPKGLAVLRDVRRRRTDWLARRLGDLSSDDRAALTAALPALDLLVGEPS